MGFISKSDPTVLNIKLTNKGRELLSNGNLTFSQFALGDSEIDYRYINYLTGKTNYSILKPLDKNPNILSYICKNDTGTTKYSISNINSTDLQITNTVSNYGLFDIPTGFTSTTILTNLEYVRNGECSLKLSELDGTKIIKLYKSSTYVGVGDEPVVGDFIMLRLSSPDHVSTDNLLFDRNSNQPFLFYKIISIVSGSFASNNLIVSVDRNLPNYSTYVGSLTCRCIVYKKDANTDYAIDYLNDNVFSFVENYNIPTKEVKHWNLSIVHKKDIDGIKTTDKKFTSFDSLKYGGFTSCIQNQENELDRIGLVHYSNESPANTYGEGLFQDTATMYLPTIMWHKNSAKKMGVRLTTSGSPITNTGLSTTYYQMFDEDNNLIGKAYNQLKVFTIEDQEMLMALSYKANRNWTLPEFTLSDVNQKCGEQCTECKLSVDITSPFANTIQLSNFVSSDSTQTNVIIQIKSGTTNISFTQWSGGTYIISDLSAGTYSVTVYDLTSPMCMVEGSVTVSDGAVAFNIGSGFNDNVWDIIKTSDDKYLAGGSFTTYSGESTKYLVKLTSGGQIYETFNLNGGFNNMITCLCETTDGGYLIGGNFTTYSGVTANRIIKLLSNGTIDTSFNSGTGFGAGSVSSIIETIDGGYLIGGSFTGYSTTTANRIIKLLSNGTIDPSFNSGTGFDNFINKIIKTPDGGYLCSGAFTTYSGVTANRIIKLLSNGTIDPSFNSGTGFGGNGTTTFAMVRTSDNSYLIGGSFTTYSGVTANRIIKLLSNGTIDTSFNSGTGFGAGSVSSIIETIDGGYLIGGSFTGYSTTTANRIIKLLSNGTIDPSFNSGTGFDDTIYCSSFDLINNTYLLCGLFTTYQGTTYNRIIQLNQDGSSNTTTN